jgi:hypothetical protein
MLLKGARLRHWMAAGQRCDCTWAKHAEVLLRDGLPKSRRRQVTYCMGLQKLPREMCRLDPWEPGAYLFHDASERVATSRTAGRASNLRLR